MTTLENVFQSTFSKNFNKRQKRYVCTRCSELYESPNPLKLHIILGCGRQTISDLWSKLSQLLMENKSKNSESKDILEFSFKLTPDFNTNKQKNAIDLSTSSMIADLKRPLSQPSEITDCITSNTENENIIYRPYSEPSASAFKPFCKVKQEKNGTRKSIYQDQFLPCWPKFTFNHAFYTHHVSSNHSTQNDESQIETLVSSLGKSKEGHICLYCGKCYSRKYGLKIHIRTHTGYKPLKCKFCLRPFGDPSNLNKHVRLHAEGDTPYKCDLCGKILVRRRDLERHLKSRHLSEIHPGRSILEGHVATELEVTDADNERANVDR